MTLNIKPIAAAVPLITWDSRLEALTFYDGKSSPVTKPFVMDIHCTRHGYEKWIGEGDDRERTTILVPVSDPLPAKPTKGRAIYTVPVYSNEFGHRDLVLNGIAVTESFCNLFNELAQQIADDPNGDMVVPTIIVETQRGEYGSFPVFTLKDWIARPTRCAAPIVKFS